jgi:UDP-glucose 4-epimerase
MEAYLTNVQGTDNVIKAATASRVKRIVVLSTDKACYPINAMGISKAMMEKVAVSHARSIEYSNSDGPIISITRYGNVMASRGSVIPQWHQASLSNQDLLVTNPDMTRYMMTLDDAVELVLYAFKKGKSGDTFVQKAPAVRLEVLAKSIISLNNSKSQIRIIGTRHGEKVYETLVTTEEMFKAVDLDEYYCIPMDARDLDYNKYFVEGQEENNYVNEYNSHNSISLTRSEMTELLKKLSLFR